MHAPHPFNIALVEVVSSCIILASFRQELCNNLPRHGTTCFPKRRCKKCSRPKHSAVVQGNHTI